MKVYFINLDRSPDRLDWFRHQGKALGLDLVRVPAVDSRELEETEIARLRALSSGNSELSASEIACLLSHRKVWQILVDGTDPWAFVAEDDIHFSGDARQFMETSEWVPAGVELVKAETTLQRQELSATVWGAPFGHELRQLRSNHYCSGGYFLSREGARRLLAFTDRHCEPADVILFSPRLGILHATPVLQLTPAICLQDMYLERSAQSSRLASVISVPRRDQRKSRQIARPAKLRREARRIAWQMVEPFRRLFLIATRRSVFRKVPFNPAEAAGRTKRSG